MPNGKPGDDWYTDIVVHRLPTLSTEADQLVAHIAELSGEARYEPLIATVEGQLDQIGYQTLASRSTTVGMEYRNLTTGERLELEGRLRELQASMQT